MNKLQSLEDIRLYLRRFAEERDWEQFHSPKNLVMALSVEVAELMEHFQWLEGAASYELDDQTRIAISEELADVQVYLVRLADQLNIDLIAAVNQKVKKNEEKYPADTVRGSAKKYTEY
jgi:NTP pyrophosphatase (non-canonical NTP hydrolase)